MKIPRRFRSEDGKELHNKVCSCAEFFSFFIFIFFTLTLPLSMGKQIYFQVIPENGSFVL